MASVHNFFSARTRRFSHNNYSYSKRKEINSIISLKDYLTVHIRSLGQWTNKSNFFILTINLKLLLFRIISQSMTISTNCHKITQNIFKFIT